MIITAALISSAVWVWAASGETLFMSSIDLVSAQGESSKIKVLKNSLFKLKLYTAVRRCCREYDLP